MDCHYSNNATPDREALRGTRRLRENYDYDSPNARETEREREGEICYVCTIPALEST